MFFTGLIVSSDYSDILSMQVSVTTMTVSRNRGNTDDLPFGSTNVSDNRRSYDFILCIYHIQIWLGRHYTSMMNEWLRIVW